LVADGALEDGVAGLVGADTTGDGDGEGGPPELPVLHADSAQAATVVMTTAVIRRRTGATLAHRCMSSRRRAERQVGRLP
jgi:hypothetical protein